jgi:prophage regulatory protein
MRKDMLTRLEERSMDYPRLIRLDKVLEITTLSVSTIYRQIAKGQFPKQIKLSERSTRWCESEVLNYINEKFKSRDGGES